LIVMLKIEEISRHSPRKSVYFIMVNKRRSGIGPKTRLSIDRDFDLGAIVNILRSTLRIYRAMLPLIRVDLCVDRISGLGLIRFRNNFAFRNLKVV
jgi:hypothetical protein